MKETIDLFLDLNDVHWSGSAYQWFFYAGILLTLLLEKRRMLRIVFGWLPFLYLVFMFNPLCIRLLNLAGLYNKAYFIRLFSFMPLIYVIAGGFMMVLRIGNGWLKLIGTGLACAVICIAGKNIYLEDWLVKAENYEKVPQETLEILDAIKAEDNQNVSIAAIDTGAVYIRQVANVITPYGRKKDALGHMLSSDPPDVQKAMKWAGEKDVDYVVAHRTDATLSAFAGRGFEPCALTDNYAVFKVDNVPRTERALNDKRQVMSITNCNAAGVPEDGDGDYTTVVYDYDTAGNLSSETYLDRDGNPYSTFEGYNSIKRTYYFDGTVKTASYLDENGNPVIGNGSYTTRYNYNNRGQVIKETYYDTQGNVIAAVGEGEPTGSACLRFYHRTNGVKKYEDSIVLKTGLEENGFSGVWFQLWDGLTDAYLFNFGESYGPGNISGEYVHHLPSGLYRLMFRGNTNLQDEFIYSLEYLTEGETLHYSYSVDDFQDKSVVISNLHIGREAS